MLWRIYLLLYFFLAVIPSVLKGLSNVNQLNAQSVVLILAIVLNFTALILYIFKKRFIPAFFWPFYTLFATGALLYLYRSEVMQYTNVTFIRSHAKFLAILAFFTLPVYFVLFKLSKEFSFKSQKEEASKKTVDPLGFPIEKDSQPKSSEIEGPEYEGGFFKNIFLVLFFIGLSVYTVAVYYPQTWVAPVGHIIFSKSRYPNAFIKPTQRDITAKNYSSAKGFEYYSVAFKVPFTDLPTTQDTGLATALSFKNGVAVTIYKDPDTVNIAKLLKGNKITALLEADSQDTGYEFYKTTMEMTPDVLETLPSQMKALRALSLLLIRNEALIQTKDPNATVEEFSTPTIKGFLQTYTSVDKHMTHVISFFDTNDVGHQMNIVGDISDDEINFLLSSIQITNKPTQAEQVNKELNSSPLYGALEGKLKSSGEIKLNQYITAEIQDSSTTQTEIIFKVMISNTTINYQKLDLSHMQLVTTSKQIEPNEAYSIYTFKSLEKKMFIFTFKRIAEKTYTFVYKDATQTITLGSLQF